MSTLLPLLVLLIFGVGANAASAALGIDFGTEYIKAAIAKPGSPIEIVLTKDSKRKEAAALAFKPSRSQKTDKDAFPERLYGGDALAINARFPSDVYPNLKALLGLSLNNVASQKYASRFPGLQIQDMAREDDFTTVGFTSKNLGKSDPFMVEELVAMQLQNIKANAEAAAGKNNFVSDVVITYPAFYTAAEKKALELAAELAGLRVLGLISDGQAVGLNYATTRSTDPKKKEVDAEYDIVYDMGAGSTTATVLKFYAKTVKGPGKKNQTVQEAQVLGVGYDKYLGGDALNDLIVQDMINKFLEMPKSQKLGLTETQVKKDGKTMVRLWKDAEKIRQVLSANQQSSTSLEGLVSEDTNFKYTLTRADFEKLARPVASRAAAPLSDALKMAGVTLADIDSVILHGGLTRTPLIQAELEKAAGTASKIKTNINADEAAAFGAAFRAATLSTSFRVKDIRISEIAGSSYTMKWTADGKDRQQKIFIETSQLGAEKQVTIKSVDDLTIEFTQAMPDQDVALPVLSVEAANLTKSANELRTSYGCANSNITTTFSVRLSALDGLPEIVSGTVSCEAQKAKEGSVMDNVKGMFGFGGKKDDQQPIKVEQDPSAAASEILEETPLPVDDPTSSGTIVSEATATTASPSASASAKFKPSTVTIPLVLKPNTIGMGASPRKALPIIKQRLVAFDTSDRNAVSRSEALNVLEAFTYRARDYLEDDSFASFSTEKIRKELATQLSGVSEWLYGDGSDAKLQEFKDKLKGLKALVDPVLKRKEEDSKREQAIDTLKNSLKNASGMMDMIKGSIEKAAKDASSAASATASSAAEAVSSVVSSAAGDDLEDEPYSATTDTAAAETTPVMPKLYEYTTEDLTSIQKIYDTVSAWLDSKTAEQSKLSQYQDPALLVADIEAKATQVGAAVSNIIMKQIKMPKLPKSSKSKTSKKAKKMKSSTTGTGTSESASSTVVGTKDEL